MKLYQYLIHFLIVMVVCCGCTEIPQHATLNGNNNQSSNNNQGSNNGNNGNTSGDKEDDKPNTGIVVPTDGILRVQGEPFLMIGAQLRTDYLLQLDGLSPEALEKYFKLAADTKLLVVSVPICWSDIETAYGKYDLSLVYKYIEYCEKYGMKLELLWYGSYMCGYSVEGYLPDYVLRDTSNYTELNASSDFTGWLGKHYWLRPNTSNLVERETAAINSMMNALYTYDKLNGNKHTVIGVQIENEPDMLATRHNAQTGYSAEALWPDLIDMLDVLGQAVKTSLYDCYTRVNLTTTYGDYLARAAEIVATPGIDYVGLDPYEASLQNVTLKLQGLKNITGNYSHIAENGGEITTNDVLMLKAVTMGCGYQIFEVVTTPHDYLKEWTLRGIYNPNFSYKSHTQNIIDAFGILRDGWVDLACASVENMLGFNVNTDAGERSTSANGTIQGVAISWSTSERGLGYAAGYDGHITVSSTKRDVVTFGDASLIEKVEKGYYDINRKWNTTAPASLSGNTLYMEACAVYRVTLK